MLRSICILYWQPITAQFKMTSVLIAYNTIHFSVCFAGTVLLVVIAHSWDFDLCKRVSIAHFMITHNLSKGNIQVTSYNNNYHAWGQT